MGALVRVKGVKLYRHPKTGILYCYHRKTRKRLLAPVGTPEFFAELAAISASESRQKILPGSLGLVISAYRDSPDWRTLKPKTRFSYERVFAALRPLDEMPLLNITRPFIFKLRDTKILPRHGTWLANYTVTVLSIVLRFAAYRGWITVNPLSQKVRRLRRSSDAAPRNRPWTELECGIVFTEAPAHLRLPIALAMCAGLRKADFLTVTRSALRGDAIRVRTSKRGVAVEIPVHPLLREALLGRPESDALQLAVNSRGEPWTETGFNSSFRTFMKRLESAGLVEPGLTPHGLRHTLGTRLREAGADDRTIADVLGQRAVSMAKHYSENARLPDAAKEMVGGLKLTGA